MLEKVSDRHSGLDFLRIISILAIVTLHILNHGGVLKSLMTPSFVLSSKYCGAWFLETLAFFGVNSLALMTGYNYYAVAVHWKKLIELWLQVVFYSISLTIAFSISGVSINSSLWFKSFFPVIGSTYWYVTAYFGMFLFIPMLNMFVEKLKRIEMQLVLIVVCLIYSVLPTVLNVDPFRLHKGHSVLFLIIMYMGGAFLKKYDLTKVITYKIAIIVCSVSSIVSVLFKICMENITLILKGKIMYGNIFICDTSPTIILNSILIFCMCANWEIKNYRIKLILQKIAAVSFGVYLIHEHFLVRGRIIRDFAVSFIESSFIVMILKVIICAISIYVICGGIEYLRFILFRRLKVKEKVNVFVMKVEEKFRILNEFR